MEIEKIIKDLEELLSFACAITENDHICGRSTIEDALSLIKELTEENERLKKNNEYILMQHAFQRRPSGDCWNDVIEKAKADTVRKMQERAKKRLDMYSHIHRYAEEAKEVTEEYANGDPVEMVSVWDACRLEHNGYDDYETMCKLQENIENIAKSRLLREIEVDIDQIAKEMLEDNNND